MTSKDHHDSGIVDRVLGKAEEIAGTVIFDETLRTAGELREERGELKDEAADPDDEVPASAPASDG